MTKKMMKQAANRAERGAKALDERMPDWYEKIDTDTLDLEAGIQDTTVVGDCGCICTQLAPEISPSGRKLYTAGFRALFPEQSFNGVFPTQHGFIASESEMYDELTQAWKREIAKRLATKDERKPTQVMIVEITLSKRDLIRDDHFNADMLRYTQRALDNEFPAADKVKVYYRGTE
jgi:hypothetical protein